MRLNCFNCNCKFLKKADFTFMVTQHNQPILRYAVNFLGSKEDAKDIVQDVFEKLWLNADRIDEDKVKNWLYTCTHNAMLNFIKKRQRMDYVQSVVSSNEYSQNEFHRFESNQVVERAVSILPPLQKSILLMRDLEGYSYDEIGNILSLNPSQVKVYLFRARLKIKNQLKAIQLLA